MKDRIKELEGLLSKYSDMYYNEGESEVTDEEFDKLFIEYKKLTGKEFDTTTKPKAGKKLVDVSHEFPDLVGTLEKAFDMDELTEWVNNIESKISIDLKNTESGSLLVTPKFDGNSVVLSFNHEGKLNKALTRGKEGKGLDLTDFFSDVTIVNKTILPEEGDFIGIKCEAMITIDDFHKIKEISKVEYANPRNLVAGVLNSLDGKDKFGKYVKLAPIDYAYINKKDIPSRDYRNGILSNEELGDRFLQYYNYGFISDKLDLEKLNDHYSYMSEFREKMPFEIDGLVVEFIDESIRSVLGRTGTKNNFDIALKFKSRVAKTKLIDIEWYVGKTGRITPVALFEPVIFNGAVCERVSLSNMDRFRDLQLKKGQEVTITYRSDVMSYLTTDGIVEGELIESIAKCPICNSDIEFNETGSFMFCSNPNCKSRKVGRIVNWFEKLDIKGVKEETISKIITEVDGFDTIDSFYDLKENDLNKVEGFLDKSVSNILEAINSKKEMFDYELFGSLMFKNISTHTSKLIFSKYTYDEIKPNGEFSDVEIKAKLNAIEGISDITSGYFIEHTKEDLDMIDRLHSKLKVNSYKKYLEENQSNSTRPIITVVFTGFRDKSLQSEIESNGSKVTSSVSKKTNVLVTPDVDGSSTKLKKARELGIEILTPEQFKQKYF